MTQRCVAKEGWEVEDADDGEDGDDEGTGVQKYWASYTDVAFFDVSNSALVLLRSGPWRKK